MSRLQDLSSSPSTASTSHEDHESNLGSTSSRKLKVTLLSSEWRSTKGGASTINRELAIQLVKHPSVEVSVYLPQCSEEDKQDAASHNVHLIEAEEIPGCDNPVDWLSRLPKGQAVDCVIGYGTVLGRQVQVIKHYLQCKCIQIVDTAPEELGRYRSHSIPRAEVLHQDVVKLCENADQVVAVGPKLADVFGRYLRSCTKSLGGVLNLTPGIFSEFADVEQATEERKTFSVLVFGHGHRDNEDFNLNGHDIAARAIAKLKDEPQPYKLLFVGAPRGEEEKLTELLLQQGIDRSQLTVRCFCESRERLAPLFCEVDLAIMPSRSEGFGLAALEALSAGLPVLVSGNSGLGEALKGVVYGSSCVVESEDPKDWANAIKAVRKKDREMRLKESGTLRQFYTLQYSWEKECDKLVERMLNISLPALLGLKLDCEISPGSRLQQGSTLIVGLTQESQGVIKEGAVTSVTSSESQVSNTTASLSGDVANGAIPSPQQVLSSIASRYLNNLNPSTQEDFNSFVRYMREVREVILVDCKPGSLIITVECGSLKILEELWQDYCTGNLGRVVQECLVTEDILKELGLSEIKMITTIDEKDYRDCQEYLAREVEIFVRMSTGTDVKFKLIESNTIKNVKERIQLSEDIPCEMQRLYFLCRLLKDKYTLCYYNIQNGSILHCDVLLIRIKVKMPTEDEISVDVSPDDKVRSVRDRIQAIGAIPPDQLCLLVYNDEKLNNRFTLRHYKVRNGSILSLVKSGVGNLDLRIDGNFQSPQKASSTQPSTQEVFKRIADKCFENVDPSNPDELNGFLKYLKEVRKVLVLDVKAGSLIFTLECGSLKILDDLWEDYNKGNLNEVAQLYLVTDDILKEFGLSSFKLASEIKREEYRDCLQRLTNQTLDRLRIELHKVFRHWIPVRRHTKEELERLARNLMLRKPTRVAKGTAAGAVLGGILAAPFTLGASLAVTAAGAGIGGYLAGRNSNRLTTEEEHRLYEAYRAINSDRRACKELQEQLNSLKKTFTSTTSVGATTSAGATTGATVTTVADALRRASPFADSSVLPRDITQLVTSSLNDNQGSASHIVEEITRIRNNLKYPDETEIDVWCRRV